MADLGMKPDTKIMQNVFHNYPSSLEVMYGSWCPVILVFSYIWKREIILSNE